MAAIRTLYSLVIFALVGCTATEPSDSGVWQSSLYADHALVGAIWDSRAEQYISPEELLGRVEGVSYLLLGEKHDNPDHHALQLRVLDHVLSSGSVSKVSFEMMNSDQKPLLEDSSLLSEKSLAEINAQLKWDNEGWNWDYYGPLIQRAVQSGVPIDAANISSAEMMHVYGAATPAEIEGVLNEATMVALEKDIDESHCGMLPESQFPSMVRVQQARDYAMAESLRASLGQQTQVLIAGNYHIRRDLGVPNYILHDQQEMNTQQIVSLAFMEVDQSSVDPEDYLQQFGEVKAYDYIWFTPAISDEDYCASLGQQ